MIKGINRSIIEVTDTGNIYYERALLVLKPEYANVQRNLLEKEAKKMLTVMTAPSKIKKTYAFMYWFVRMGLSAVAGAFLTYLFIGFMWLWGLFYFDYWINYIMLNKPYANKRIEYNLLLPHTMHYMK